MKKHAKKEPQALAKADRGDSYLQRKYRILRCWPMVFIVRIRIALYQSYKPFRDPFLPLTARINIYYRLPLTARLTFWPGNYIWSFLYGFGVAVRDIWERRPGFYSEIWCKSRGHSGSAWGAILRKVLVLIWFPTLPYSFFQEHVPRIDFSLNIAIRKEL